MQVNIPISKQQKEFEERAYIIIKLLAELSESEQKRVLDFILFTYNK